MDLKLVGKTALITGAAIAFVASERSAYISSSVVTIDGNFLPASMLLPVQSHFIQTERFAKQMELPLPTRKRLWQQIVRAKIKAQGQLLRELHDDDSD